MEEIQEIFAHYLDQTSSLDMAEAEFRRALVDDPDLRRQYRQYCRDNGTSERNGFTEFAETYLDDQNRVWDSLNDYDEIE